MAVYSRGITYNDRIATITISRQLQKRADNCDRLLFTYAKALWFQIDPGQPRQIHRHRWIFQSHYYSLACVQEKTKKTTIKDFTNRITFYCSRFHRQLNLSSLYLTQVTFEDLPWFTSSINRQTLKTKDRLRFQVPIFRKV